MIPVNQTTVSHHERILVALDGSARAEHILPAVTLFARQNDAQVILLREAWGDHVPLNPDNQAEAVAIAQIYLNGVAERLRAVGIAVEARVYCDGSPARSILQGVKVENASLIAMATHGRSGLPRVLMGSVMVEVLHQSDIPVLTVRSLDRDGDDPSLFTDVQYRRILVPLDSQEYNQPVLDYVHSFLDSATTQVELLEVLQTDVDWRRAVDPALVAVPDLHVRHTPNLSPSQEQTRIACSELERLILETTHSGRWNAMTMSGDNAAKCIIEEAISTKCDVIVMATHARAGLSRLALGSVAEAVVHRSPCPVLLLPPRALAHQRVAAAQGMQELVAASSVVG